MDSTWNPTRYDTEESFVWKYGADVVEILAPRRGERILDLGCGTGHLTAQIAAAGAIVIGIDNSPDMIEQARHNYPQLRFEVADAAGFHFETAFDAVFSNAALHWMKQPRQVAACVYAALRSGGRFVAEFGGKDNIKAITAALNQAIRAAGYPIEPDFNPWYFPALGEYAALLEEQGFMVTDAALFDRPTRLDKGEQGLQNWIEMFGGEFLKSVPADQHLSVIRDVEDQLRPDQYHHAAWWVDYKRLRIVACKE